MSTDSPQLAITRVFTENRAFQLRLALVVLFGIALLISTGCTSFSDYVHNGFKVGPNYQKPPAPLANEWIDSKSRGVNVASRDLRGWWKTFNDPKITQS